MFYKASVIFIYKKTGEVYWVYLITDKSVTNYLYFKSGLGPIVGYPLLSTKIHYCFSNMVKFLILFTDTY